MQIVIPMAGAGNRFVEADYKEPKPLIKIRGKRVIEYVCDMYDKDNDEFIFICNIDHYRSTDMEKILKDYVKKCTIIPISPHKLGPVFTIIISGSVHIKKDSPVIISYCDTPFTWDYDFFKEYVKDKDGCLVSCKGFHPHSLSSTLWAHSKLDGDNRILEIKEKSCYTKDHLKEHASSGVYYFGKGEYVTKYFRQLIDEDRNFNGEYYITLVYNLLIRDGLKVYSYLNDFVLSFGTPSEVKNFEAWQTILDGGQVNSEKDLIKCYNYWKLYRMICK